MTTLTHSQPSAHPLTRARVIETARTIAAAVYMAGAL